MPVQIKRVYEPASPSDGDRVLIDRLWPRGVSRLNAKLDECRVDGFRRRYIEERRDERPRLIPLRRRARGGTLTLGYSAHHTEHNDAVVLAEILRRGFPKTRP